jgi:hypothetical protein
VPVLVEAATIEAVADHDLNAIEILVIDPGGDGFATLIDPPQAVDLVVALLRELGELLPAKEKPAANGGVSREIAGYRQLSRKQ